jgi:hypothetical protein
VEATDGIDAGCRFHVRLADAEGRTADYDVSNGPSGGAFATPEARALDFTPTQVVVDPLHECLVYAAGAAKPVAARHWER